MSGVRVSRPKWVLTRNTSSEDAFDAISRSAWQPARPNTIPSITAGERTRLESLSVDGLARHRCRILLATLDELGGLGCRLLRLGGVLRAHRISSTLFLYCRFLPALRRNH